MIKYHGTPIGGTRDEVARFLLGRHALIPFPRQEDLGIAAEACQSFIFDNGAYTVWKQGGTLDVEGYIDWVRLWKTHPGFDFAIVPDVIGGSEDENDEMAETWPDDLRHLGAPVWHPNEGPARIIRLVDAGWHRIAIGASSTEPVPGTKGWWYQVEKGMDAICDSNGRPPVKLHGLKMLDPDLFTRLPLSSADSVNVARNSKRVMRFGMYVPPTASQRAAVIASRIEVQNSAPAWQRSPQIDLIA